MSAVGSMDDLASHSFDLVNRELASTLDAARRELEDFIDGHSGKEALIRTADHLHLARGALKIVEIHGAAMLAEEMEQTCRRLAEPGEQEKSDQGLEALTRAMVQLPAYLERLMSGSKDVALALLPLLNDLRRARDKPSLSEGTLVLLNAGPLEGRVQATRAASGPVAVDAGRDFDKVAQRLRPAFQTALLGWIKGADVTRHLDELLRVSTSLERGAGTDAVRQLWTVMTAVLTAVRAGGLEASVTLKRLIGQADRQLKRLIDGGEPALANSPPVELVNSLLYYVARATTDDPRINKLRDLYGLREMLPSEDQIEIAREGLAGPSVKLMRTVAQAIKEDLSAVKDVLDIFVRTGMQSTEKLAPQLDMLKKIGDTLGVLGLASARTQIQREAQELGALVASNRPVDQVTLEKIAATLLAVEDTLDRELVRSVTPGDTGTEVSAADVQHKHVTQAVMGECIVNLAKVKEAVVQLVNQPSDVRVLETAKPQLRGIVAGLVMLSKTKAVSVVERVGEVIATRLAPGSQVLKPEYLERLADAIVSVEYYMETVSAGRNDPWYMLENAERCLDLLEKLPVVKPARAAETAPAPAAVAPVPTPPPAPTPAPPPAPSKPAAKRPSVMQVDEDRSDPELVELFIEEAKEEIASIQRYLPVWSEHLDNSEALIALRRSFHTLKGSGRMVGAQLIGEFAWSIENLLNRVINQTLETTPPMVAFVVDAVKALPQLVEQLELGIPPKLDVHLVMKRAEAFAEGDPDAEHLTSHSVRVQVLEVPIEPTATGMDPVLADIFVKEMRGHVDVIQKYIAAAETQPEPHLIDEPLYRACHTLLGSGRMAGFEPAMALAGPMAEHLRRHFDAGTGLTDTGLAALRTAASEVEKMAAAIVANRDYTLDPALSELMEALAESAIETPVPTVIEPALTEASLAHAAAASPEAASAASSLAPIESAPAAAPVQPVVVDPVTSFDPEIAAIFAEEAAEILDNSELALRALRQKPEASATVELQRLLHTLKGGARMAGVTPMGDLSHALETLLERIADGRLQATNASLDLVQRSLDQLQQMRDAIDSGRGVLPAPALVADLEGVGSVRAQETLAAATPAAATAVAATPVVAEPVAPPVEAPAEVVASDEAVAEEIVAASVEPVVAFVPPVEPPVAEPVDAFDTDPAPSVPQAIDSAAIDSAATDVGSLEPRGGETLEIELPRSEPAASDSAAIDGEQLADEPVVGESFAADPLADEPEPVETIAPLLNDPFELVIDPTGTIALTPADIAELESIRIEAIKIPDAQPELADEEPTPAEQPPAFSADATIVVEDVAIVAALTIDPPAERASEAPEIAEAAQLAPVAAQPEPVEAPRVVEFVAAAEPPAIVELPAAAEFDASVAPAELAAVAELPEAIEAAASAVETRAEAPVAQPQADLRSLERAETARVDAALLDALLNGAGEINIFQSRITQQMSSIEFHLGELGATVSRLRDQLRKLEAETEAQILHRHQDDVASDGGFDPLELDRYSTIQQLSRALAESANDVASINELLNGLTNETGTLLTQQARVTAELQNGLMQTRMVPFQRHVTRLARIVRQACSDTGKLAELVVEGENSELDRQVLESMLPPFEHLLRNAVAHGIEPPATRKQRGKPEAGKVFLKIKREGAEVIIEVSDDGGGLDLQAIRRKAYEKGLLAENQKITDDQAIEMILQPGFSTAGEVTLTAGRGVGMDVVDNEVKKLGGSMRIDTTAGQGTRFLMRLPYTLAITHALIVNVGDETFALPLPTVEGITRLSRERMLKHLTEDEPKLDYGGITYRIQHLGSLVGAAPSALPEDESAVSLVLIRAGESSTALLMDSLEGSREIVVKTLGPHIANVAGVTGATILGDGRVIMILDPATLVRAQRAEAEPAPPVPPPVVERALTALVVDDSITMRRVTQRLLERRGVKVHTARDGLDAITVLQDHEVDVILLDIEMPRMDGYQFATHVRNDAKSRHLPIIMITSRSGEKHRAKAIEIGVNDYLSKPYQETQLVAAIEALLGRPL